MRACRGLLSLACAAASVTGCSGWNWTPENIAISKSRGHSIVYALEKFRTAIGVYPASLGDLVPDYDPYIEPPAAGTGEWRYGAFGDGKAFTLHFTSGGALSGGAWEFDSRDGKWHPTSS